MPRLIDADKAKEVLIDYYHIRTNIQQMSMEEAFSRVPTVDAIPVEWINRWLDASRTSGLSIDAYTMLHDWEVMERGKCRRLS